MSRRRRFGLTALFFLAACSAGCATPDFERPKGHSEAITEVSDTEIGRLAGEWSTQHDGLSGFYPLLQGLDALAVRLELAERAEKSIDLQYFLMKPDTAGMVVANSLLRAADRGVRVRFLLDDVFTTSPDRDLLLIDQHPNIEVRIFNPISRTGVSLFNFLGDFERANRRMHNKSFTVDNSMSVVGGRNIADEYFQLENDSVFLDFDVLAIGPIARQVSTSFDEYWNHSRSLPIGYIASNDESETLEQVRADMHDQLSGTYHRVYQKSLESNLVEDLVERDRELLPARARVISDSPDKLVGTVGETEGRLEKEMLEVVLETDAQIIFITPYYVPGEERVDIVRKLVDKGVEVMIVTNSLASNNHIPVHSAYTRYRKEVIRAGAKLYEARANAAHEAQGSSEGPDALTMHTKAIVVDRRYLFVGSLNLDPRSIDINAEMGLLIDSPEMVRAATFDAERNLETLTYRVTLNEEGNLEWRSTIDGQEVVETKEPLSSRWRRFQAWLYKLAPESQL